MYTQQATRTDRVEQRAERASRHQRRNRLENIRLSEMEDFGDTSFATQREYGGDGMDAVEPLTLT